MRRLTIEAFDKSTGRVRDCLAVEAIQGDADTRICLFHPVFVALGKTIDATQRADSAPEAFLYLIWVTRVDTHCRNAELGLQL